MKGLLPLTLSTSSCSSLANQLPEEALEQRVDDYFPEVLVQDLELSKIIFEARSSSLSPYQSGYLRVQTLGAIQERNSMVSFLDQQEDERSGDAASDSCSATETDASSVYDAAPPSFFLRRQSIDTSVPSLDPAKAKMAPPRSSTMSPSESSRCESSWIETDSDVEDDREEDAIYGTVLHLSPRPPTPPEFEARVDSRSSSGNMHKFLHRKSHSSTDAAALASPPGQHLSNSTTQAWRSSSTQYSRHSHTQMQCPDSPESLYLPMSQYTPPTPHSQSMHYMPDGGLARRASNRSIIRPANNHTTNATAIDDCARTEYNQFVSSLDSKYAPRADSVYIRPSPPPSPLPSVQMWLNGSAQLFSLPFQSDELARVVPLPPDVMETLRVTTACFPETMLLSSSLTIETIRAYSRKARNPGTEFTPPPTSRCSTPTSKQSLWRRVVKRGSRQSNQRTRDVHTPTASLLQSPSLSSLESPKPWTSIKNVFGNCSDYICDALYSHIVAYNYISALVARYPTSLGCGRSCSSPVGSQHDDIPKKAASLLGLNERANSTSAASIRSARRFSSSHWGREDFMATSPLATSPHQDMAIRSIQTELLRCIRRLIATARLMAESDGVDEKMVEMDIEDADVLFMRSLCEIVRVNEEAAYL
ncbi:hypothetical protein M431DRAFT_149314 [Trichoderma harzianum CBS 226.95]|uniref:Uncharacterized protein n=1 Tax=Trichoderma harzianum CBS 226.95 TaxID=983964 RepID=A0A2T4A4D0_TRIHA|nr:hypothetical protein M431DRAFT_149314 [Trichoderma harzianum CBS 226.95]PTB51823.1 hypothetical protein M431DRAFT_149314 [Trichoderma harzianum CBS 226.95]